MKKRILTAILMASMVFALCACGNGNATNTETENTQDSQNTEADADADTDVEADAEEGKVTYTIYVTDEGGNPVAGAMVQLCDDANCMPKITDANGAAVFSVEEFDGYKTKVTSVPEGYEIISDEYTYLESGVTEVTLTVKAIQ